MKKLLLLDGNSMLFRAYYATLYTHRMTTSNGIPTNAVFGFIMMLHKAVDMIEPDAILVAWDAGKPTFRHQKYEAYKGTRKPIDEDLIVQFPIVREFLDTAGIARYEEEGFEADDIIGSTAKSFPDTKTTILTSDRDLLQLVDASTDVLLMKKGLSEMEVLTADNFKEKMGLEPLQIIDLKGLMGDASDNIPGVAGVGEKTAKKLLDTYESVENVYAHIDEIKGKLKEKLQNDHEQAMMSKDLATIFTGMQIPVQPEAMAFDGWSEDLAGFYQKYEMRSLMNAPKTPKPKTRSLKEMDELDLDQDGLLLVPVCDKNGFLHQKLFGFMIPYQDDVYYLPLERAQSDLRFHTFLQMQRINTWDAKETNHLLDRYGFPTVDFKEDLHIAAFLLHSQATDLDALVQALKIDLPYTFHDLSKKDKNKEPYNPERLMPVMQAFALQLAQKEKHILDEVKKKNLLYVYEEIEKPLIPILYRMENEGIFIDEKTLDEIGDNCKARMDALADEIHSYSETDFNINSPKQLAAVLYDELGLKAGKKRSTGAEVLEKLRGEHPIVEALLEYRKFSKIMSTYIEGLKKHIQPDEKIHTTFNQAMTQTGRLSSSEPNLQNISVRDEEGREIRKAFAAGEGKVLLSADYSQIELRMLAHMADEQHMIRAFQNDEDIHNTTATLIFNCRPEEVDSRMRRVAKTVNFGIVYGQTAFGLSSQLKISRQEATDFMNAYFANYPNIHTFMNSLVEDCKEKGYVETLFHRRRLIPEINDKNFMTREFGKRAAMNAPIQGSAADLIKIAMIRVDQAMKEAGVKSRMLLQIHDELIFEVPREELDQMIALVREAMEHAMELRVPLKAGIQAGKTWYEAK